MPRAPADVVSFHSEIAEDFHLSYRKDPNRRERVEIWNRFLDRYAKGASFGYDIGCGSGILACEMAKRGIEAVGIDAAPTMLAIARKTAEEKGLTNLSFRQERVPFADTSSRRKADIVISSSVIEYLDSLPEALAFLVDMLADNGVALLSVSNRASLSRKAVRMVYRLTGHPRYFGLLRHFMTVEDMKAALSRCGLEYKEHAYFGRADRTNRFLSLFLPSRLSSNMLLFAAAKSRPAIPGRLRVLMISYYPGAQGGVAVFAETTQKYLANCDVTFLPVGKPHDRRESTAALAKRMLTMLARLIRLLRCERFDIIHINPSLNFRSAARDGFILLTLRVLRIRGVMVYFHGWDRQFAGQIRKHALARACLRWLLNGVERIAVLAPEFKTTLMNMGVQPGRILVTRTLFDGAGIKKTENTTPKLRRCSILYLSRFEREKGVYELLDAFARLAPEFPDLDLIMAGEGAESGGLKARALAHGLSARISFPGYITGEEKAKALCDCTIFALPTYFPEGMPVALLEAMGAGKPLLTSKAGGIPYIVSDPENGVVLDTVTTDTVAAGLHRLLGDSPFCEAAGKRNREYAWKHFEASVVAAEMEAAYQDIVNQRRYAD